MNAHNFVDGDFCTQCGKTPSSCANVKIGCLFTLVHENNDVTTAAAVEMRKAEIVIKEA